MMHIRADAARGQWRARVADGTPLH